MVKERWTLYHEKAEDPCRISSRREAEARTHRPDLICWHTLSQGQEGEMEE